LRRLNVSREARTDLVEIFLYIAKDNVGAARRMHSRIDATLRTIASQPGIGRARGELIPGIRSLASGNYVVYYREVKGGVRILRILHGARDIQQLFE
jgi:toxin ParE1/3/4